jgi:hypothetical protein
VSTGGAGEGAAESGEKKFRGGLVVIPACAYFISYETYNIIMRLPVKAALGGKESDKKRRVEKEFGRAKVFRWRIGRSDDHGH